MFDKYIEKNISRQVYLCERLYEKRQLRVKEVAEKNDVCSATIHHDLAVLQERFLEAVVIKKCGRDQYQADFALSLPELRWQLCRESDFFTLSQTVFSRGGFVAGNRRGGVYFPKQGLPSAESGASFF